MFLKKILKKEENSPKIWHKTPKIFKNIRKKTNPFHPKHLLKRFLRWLKLRGMDGELLIKEETNIDDILREWLKELLIWLVNINISGFLFLLAILPFRIFDIKFEWGIFTYIFCFGIMIYIINLAFNGFINGLCKVARSFKR
jgi:hypothetical protein